MTTFVTQLKKYDETLWEGPRIEAKDWDEAEESCQQITSLLTDFEACILVGEFVEETDYSLPHNANRLN